MASKKFRVAVEIAATDAASSKARTIFRGIAAEARLLSSGVSGAYHRIVNLKSAVMGLTAGYLGMRGVHAADEWASGAAELSRLSRQVGMSTEGFQEFEQVAEHAGVAPDAFRLALNFANKELGAFHAGTGKLSAFLKSYPALATKLRSAPNTEAALSTELEVLRRLPDAASKAYMARVMFGRGSAGMVRMAELSAAAIDKEREAARANGLVTTQAGLDAESFARAQNEAGDAIEGVKNAIGASLLPVLTPAVNKFADWVRQNRALVASKVTALIERTGQVVYTLATDTLPRVSKFMSFIADNWREIYAGAKVFAMFWAGTKIIGGIQAAVAAAAPLIGLASGGAAAAGAASAFGTGAGGSFMAKLAAGAGPWGVVAAAAIGTALLVRFNNKGDKERLESNTKFKAQKAAFEAGRWARALPDAADQAERNIYSVNNPAVRGMTIEQFRAHPYWQGEVGKETQRVAALNYGVTSIDQAEARAASFGTPAAFQPNNPYAPNVHGAVKVEVELSGAPKGTKMRTRSTGQVDASGTMRRLVGVDAYEPEYE